MAFPPEFLRELEARNPIEEVASAYVNLKRRGKNLVGLCPFHNEKTGSFNIYPGNNSFYCFGCNKGGDVISFVMGVENLDFPEAVRWLAQRAGMTVPEDGWTTACPGCAPVYWRSTGSRPVLLWHPLHPRGKARPGLFQGPGLDGKTIRHFGLGYAPEGGYALTDHLKAKGYTQEELLQSDMVRLSKKGYLYDRYRGRVMFPIFDLRGNVVAFGGRILTDEKPKYINTSDTPVYHKSSGLFAMNFAKDSGSRQLILAEGYMDVISLHQAGFTNAVAPLGTAFTPNQAMLLKRYTNEVILSFDSDGAGIKAALRALPILRQNGLRGRVLSMKPYKDPDELIKAEGAESYQKRIDEAESGRMFELLVLYGQYNQQDPEKQNLLLPEELI